MPSHHIPVRGKKETFVTGDAGYETGATHKPMGSLSSIMAAAGDRKPVTPAREGPAKGTADGGSKKAMGKSASKGA